MKYADFVGDGRDEECIVFSRKQGIGSHLEAA